MTIHHGTPPIRPGHTALPVVEVYGDESLKRGHYDVLGGLWIPAHHAEPLRARIAEARARHDCTGEVKWSKCSGSSVHPLYADVVDLATAAIHAGRANTSAS